MRPLRFPDCKRAFWLMVALAITWLINVSTTAAVDRSAASLVVLLGRDLAALRLHSNELVAKAASPGPPAAALTTDVGDGSPSFHARAMTTLMRSVHRRVDRLTRVYAQRGRNGDVRDAQLLKIRLHELESRIDRLVEAGNQTDLHAAYMQVQTTLDRIEIDLAALGGEQDTPAIGQTKGEMAAKPVESRAVQHVAPSET